MLPASRCGNGESRRKGGRILQKPLFTGVVLEQGWEAVATKDIKGIGLFLRWITEMIYRRAEGAKRPEDSNKFQFGDYHNNESKTGIRAGSTSGRRVWNSLE